MSGPIATARAELADVVTAALTNLDVTVVHSEMPRRISPPCIIIAEQVPLTAADEHTIGTTWVNLEAVIVAGVAGAAGAVDLADTITDALITAIPDATAAGYSILNAADQQPYLVSRVTTSLGPYQFAKD